jgi:DNA-binding HxlR family transcriptional regulator
VLTLKDIPDVKELLKWEGSPRLLIYLYFNETGHMTQMIDEIGGSSRALYNALPTLRQYKLITEGIPKQIHRRGAKRKEYNLTKKGKAVAKLMLELQDELSGTQP